MRRRNRAATTQPEEEAETPVSDSQEERTEDASETLVHIVITPEDRKRSSFGALQNVIKTFKRAYFAAIQDSSLGDIEITVTRT